MGKSSWVPSRTQGSTPMLFCRWSNVLWLLHPLPVPSYGWWLDQGRWSLRLFLCFCGNDQKLWHCIKLNLCVCTFELWSFRYLWTWFVITLSTPMFSDECFRTGCNCEWWPLNLLRSWLYVWYVVWNPSRFHGLPRLYGFKLDGLTMQMVAIRLNLL